jgi:hypothetical protein
MFNNINRGVCSVASQRTHFEGRYLLSFATARLILVVLGLLAIVALGGAPGSDASLA